MSGTFRSALGFEWLRAWSQVQSFPALRRFTTLRLNDIVTFTHLGIRMTHWTLERTILALYLNTNCSVRKKRQERRFYCTFFSLRSNDLRSLFFLPKLECNFLTSGKRSCEVVKNIVKSLCEIKSIQINDPIDDVFLIKRTYLLDLFPFP